MYRYSGAPKTFLQYLDGATGATLVAEPGNVYHIIPTRDSIAVPPSADFVEEKNEPDVSRPAPEPAKPESDGE